MKRIDTTDSAVRKSWKENIENGLQEATITSIPNTRILLLKTPKEIVIYGKKAIPKWEYQLTRYVYENPKIISSEFFPISTTFGDIDLLGTERRDLAILEIKVINRSITGIDAIRVIKNKALNQLNYYSNPFEGLFEQLKIKRKVNKIAVVFFKEFVYPHLIVSNSQRKNNKIDIKNRFETEKSLIAPPNWTKKDMKKVLDTNAGGGIRTHEGTVD